MGPPPAPWTGPKLVHRNIERRPHAPHWCINALSWCTMHHIGAFHNVECGWRTATWHARSVPVCLRAQAQAFSTHWHRVLIMGTESVLAWLLPSKIRASLPMHQYGARCQGAVPCKNCANMAMRFKRDLRYLGDAQAFSLISVLPQWRSRRYEPHVQPQRLCGRCARDGLGGGWARILFQAESQQPHNSPQSPTILHN